MKRAPKVQAGFTLIELMMVIAIILSLFSISLPTLLSVKRAVNETSAIAKMRAIVGSEESYKTRNLGGGGLYATLAQLEAQNLVRWPTAGTYFLNGYTFVNLGAPTATQWGVCATPDIVLHGDRDFVATNDGYLRAQASSLVAPATVAAAQALKLLQ